MSEHRSLHPSAFAGPRFYVRRKGRTGEDDYVVRQAAGTLPTCTWHRPEPLYLERASQLLADAERLHGGMLYLEIARN